MDDLRPSGPELDLRGRLVRGKPACRGADGEHLHPQPVLSVLVEGKLKAINLKRAVERIDSSETIEARVDESGVQFTRRVTPRFFQPPWRKS